MKAEIFLTNSKTVKSKKIIENPEVSIILPINNTCEEFFLERAIESVLNQSFKSFELIIVDDLISDKLESIITNYINRDNRVVYIKNSKESKLTALRINQGLINIRGKYIAYQSQYGHWYDNALENLYNEIISKDSECLIYGKSKIINDEKYGTIEIGQDFKYHELLDRNFIVSNSIIHSKNIIKSLGGYDCSVDLQLFYEWDTWIRWSSKVQFVFIDKIIGIIENYNLQLFIQDIDVANFNLFRSIQFTERMEKLKLDNLPTIETGEYNNKQKITILVVKVFFDPTLDVTFTNFIKASSEKYNMIYMSSNQLNEQILEIVDIVVLHRTYDTCSSEFLKLAKYKKKPIIYWLDDDLTNVHQFIEGFLVPGTTQFDDLIYQLKGVDLIVSANSQISSSVRKYNHKVKDLKITVLNQYINKNYSKNNNVFKIAYIGNPRKGEIDFIWEDIVYISSKYKEKIEFYFWGYVPERIEDIKYSKVYTKQYTMSYYEYLERLNRESFNLIIAPLFESKFNSGKSVTKYLEACVCGAVGLYSEISTYRTIIDGVNGFKVENEKDQWKNKIEQIINMDLYQIEQVYNNAVQDVMKNHSTESQMNNFENIILQVKSNNSNDNANLFQRDERVPDFNVDNLYKELKEVIKEFDLQEKILFEKYLFEIKFNLEKLIIYKKNLKAKICYIIWGASDSGKIIKKIIDKIFPEFILIGFVDKFKKGVFCGVNIYSTNQLENLKFDYVFIATSGGRCQAELNLMDMNLKKYEHFSSFFY